MFTESVEDENVNSFSVEECVIVNSIVISEKLHHKFQAVTQLMLIKKTIQLVGLV